MAGNFENLPLGKEDKIMFKDMYDTITRLELWSWLSDPKVPGENGFMWSGHPELHLIMKNMTYGGHSGASFGVTMRIMQRIAVNGWDSYVYTLVNAPTCECMRERGLTGYCGVAGGGVPACDH